MRKGTFTWIVVLMSAALVGLIIFQIYWINTAIGLSKERFQKDVHDAMLSVSNKLEKTEILYTTAKTLQLSGEDRSFIRLDSITFFRRKSPFDTTANTQNPYAGLEVVIDEKDTTQMRYNDEWLSLNNERLDLVSPGFQQSLEQQDIGVEIKRFKATIDSIERFDEALKQNIKKVVEKSQMITVVLNELFTKERPINRRVQLYMVDSLLREEFSNKGIREDYAFGIYNATEDTLITRAAGMNPAFLKATDLKVSLFPNDILGDLNYLMVYFPDETRYVLRNIWGSLLTSVILILIIMFCFGYAMRTIWKQKKLSEIKNDFINNMTHEFKTPISTVSLATQALQDPDVRDSNAFTEKYIRVIEEENARLGRQVEKVLQMATLEKQDFELKMEELSINRMVERAVQSIQLQLERKGGQVELHLDAQRDQVLADELHLTNIIYNLLDNAIKYSPDAPRISIGTANRNGQVKIEVSDKGIGMSKETQHRIFEKFYRVPTGNIHDVKGFGLGLAYVKTMVEAHGGEIEVQSELYKGSVFKIYLHTHE